MGIGKKTRIQAKRDRREISREKYKAELIKTICLIFIVGLTASLIVVKVITIIYPIINDHAKDFIKSYRSANVNPFFKSKLKHEDFKSLYFQKEPILFDSLQGDAHTEAIWTHFETICSHEADPRSAAEEDQGFSHPLYLSCLEHDNRHEDNNTCHRQNSGLRIFNFSTMGAIRSLITTPHLVTQGNATKAITHFRNEISLELLVPSSAAEESESGKRYPTFQQHPQSWNELIVGRKKWFLYRPGTLPSVGFNPHDSLEHWLQHVYPSLGSSSRPVEVLQEEGQVLYVPEGWYHASLPSSASFKSDPPDITKTSALHTLLTSCGGQALPPLHGHNSSRTTDTDTDATAAPLSSPPPYHPYALSIQQQASAPEIIHSEYYYCQRGKKFLSQLKYASAIESFLQGVALGAGVEEVDITASSPFSAKNDFSLVLSLGDAFAAVGEIQKAERAFLFAISLNRLNPISRMALVELYLQQHMLFMARAVLTGMDMEKLTHPDLYIFKYLSNFDKTCVPS